MINNENDAIYNNCIKPVENGVDNFFVGKSGGFWKSCITFAAFLRTKRQESKRVTVQNYPISIVFMELSNTFIGQVQSKTDEKGRIFVPSSYRRVLKEMSSPRIIMRRDTDNECLIFYPEQVWNKKVNDLRAVLDEWNAEDQMLLMQFMADAEILETDTQGRVLLTKQNLQLIGAKQNVLFVGMLDRFALWAPENYAEKSMGQKALADKIRERIQAAKNNRE